MSEAEFTFKTPAIPEAITNIRLDKYKNIFEYKPSAFPDRSHPNLWGTETLFGDWDGRLLIVLKDFSSTEALKKLRVDNRPLYSHAPENITNRNLISFLNNTEFGFLNQRTNTSCEMLYMSACFLIRCGDGLSGRISREALEASWPVIEFTISRMRNLTDIVLCGKEAFVSFQSFGQLVADRKKNYGW